MYFYIPCSLLIQTVSHRPIRKKTVLQLQTLVSNARKQQMLFRQRNLCTVGPHHLNSLFSDLKLYLETTCFILVPTRTCLLAHSNQLCAFLTLAFAYCFDARGLDIQQNSVDRFSFAIEVQPINELALLETCSTFKSCNLKKMTYFRNVNDDNDVFLLHQSCHDLQNSLPAKWPSTLVISFVLAVLRPLPPT